MDETRVDYVCQKCVNSYCCLIQLYSSVCPPDDFIISAFPFNAECGIYRRPAKNHIKYALISTRFKNDIPLWHRFIS